MSWTDSIEYVQPYIATIEPTAHRIAPDLTTGGVVVLNTAVDRYIVGTVDGYDFGRGPLWLVYVSQTDRLKVVHSSNETARKGLVPSGDGMTAEQIAQAKRLEFGRGRDEGIAAYTAAGTVAAKAVKP